MSLKKHRRVGAALCVLALTAAACGDSGGGSGAASKDLKKGGTLKLAHLRDLLNYDTNQAYEVRSWGYHLRATIRTLMSYENTPDPKLRDTPVPDLAKDDPKISADGREYTFELKDGIKYADSALGVVTPQDVERGIERLCDPNGLSGGLSYYTATIDGMTDFCDDFSKVKTEDVAAVKDFVEGHSISGIKTDAKKITFKLKQPAGDFVSMLALTFSAPVPVKALDYLTDSNDFRQNMAGFATGPYMIEKYTPKQSLHLKRNDNWDPKKDKLRGAFVDRIEITLNAPNVESIQQQIEAEDLDGYLRGIPPNNDASRAEREKDERLRVDKDGACVYYLAFNLHHSSPGGKIIANNKVVRQAINYAIDKPAILQVLGGRRNGEPTGQVLSKTLLGYKKIDPYPSPDSEGDVEKAKQMLTAAGVKNLELDMIYSNDDLNKRIFGVVADTLKKAGIKVNAVPKDNAAEDTTNPKADNWDLYYTGWCPDWNGNGARTFFTPLLSDPGLKNYKAGGSYNYGGYDNPAVDRKVEQALAAQPEDAAAIWADIDVAVMEDAPWVPLYTSNSVTFISKRLKGYVFFPYSTSFDLTNVSVL